MLSGESNAGERWKATIGLIGKKSNFARATHLFCAFLYRCFARLQCETSTSYTFFGGNVVHVLVHFFFTAAHFHIGGRYLFPFCHHRYNIFMLFFQPKNISFFFFFLISRSRSLSPFCSLNFAGLPPNFPFSLSFSFSIFQICGHDN